MGAAAPFTVELPRNVDAPRLARRLLVERFSNVLDIDALATCQLLVSELVTNAVRHGRGAIMLKTALDRDRLRVEVIDQGSGFERAIRERDLEQVGGWGLQIVDAEASRWGVDEDATHIWFELECGPPSTTAWTCAPASTGA